MSKMKTIENLFDVVVHSKDGIRSSCKVKSNGVVYTVCGCMVVMRPENKKRDNDLQDGVFVKAFADSDLLETSEPSSFSPENVFYPQELKITKATVDNMCSLVNGCYITAPTNPIGHPAFLACDTTKDGKHYKCVFDIPFANCKQLYTFDYALFSFNEYVYDLLRNNKDISVSIAIAKKKRFPTLILRDKDTLAYLCFRYTKAPDNREHSVDCKTILINNEEYMFDGFNDKNYTYKNIIKKGQSMSALDGIKYAALKSKASKKLEEMVATMNEVQETPTAAAVENSQQTQVAEAVEQKPNEEQPTPVEETAVQENKEVVCVPAQVHTESQPIKKQRQRKAPVSIGFDFTAVINYLGAPIEDPNNVDTEKALEEVKVIRDLVISAVRRMTNLSDAIYNRDKDKLLKFEQLQTIFSK